ncbi:polysaccharide deacetylase family protein [[Flexibacter] sp. ATCC 35208]|uniref:polysaccharide deacetylase family protein n=1 Tax=[Flexibacter] sp. ATCC 35208 TaxID=1936242 RepID=UPI0009CA22E3|nr:polysaccharide deacetylase family protein [[Flexibacter] sp. ATCC 35208]OMP80424.1 polysaccharide deacetylase [[Flexibacter] sp. ATCC 35208]
MLTHRNTNIVLIALIALFLWLSLPWWAFVLLFIPYSGALVWGAMQIQSGFFLKAVCAAETSEKVVALTFDDGPLTEFTPQILDILHKAQAPAAFFCIGNRIAGQEALLNRIDAEGHVIGNHSFSHHFWFDLFPAKKMLAELQQVDSAIEQVTGKRPRLFRPPYGVTNPNVRRAVQRGKYTAIGWNIRSLDTVAKQADELMNRILSGLKPGAVILMHDSIPLTVEILPALIAHIREQGYTIKRIDQLLNIPAYA